MACAQLANPRMLSYPILYGVIFKNSCWSCLLCVSALDILTIPCSYDSPLFLYSYIMQINLLEFFKVGRFVQVNVQLDLTQTTSVTTYTSSDNGLAGGARLCMLFQKAHSTILLLITVNNKVKHKHILQLLVIHGSSVCYSSLFINTPKHIQINIASGISLLTVTQFWCV